MNRFHLRGNPLITTTPNQSETLDQIRQRILSIILPFTALLGIILLLTKISTLVNQGAWLGVGAYIAGILGLIATALVSRIPYPIRVVILLVILTLLGTVAITLSGFSGPGMLFLLAITPLAMILLGVKKTALVSASTLVLLVLLAVLAGTNVLPLPILEGKISSSQTWDWVSTIALFTLISAVLSISTRFLFEGLEESLTIEQKTSEELKNHQVHLEQNVADRTQELRNYIARMRTASDISKAISSTLDPQALLDQIVALLQKSFNLYYAGVFLIDENRQYAVLRAGSGDAGKIMLSQKHQLAIDGSSMIGWAIKNHQARIALEANKEIIRFRNPALPFTRSEMALPLISRDQAIGAITLQSSEPNAFSEEDITILQYIADILATSLENANLYQNAETNLQIANEYYRRFIKEGWGDLLQTSGSLAASFTNGNTSEFTEEPSTIRVPLSLRDQEIGSIDLEVDRQALSEEDLAFIDSIAFQTAQALENARLLDQTLRRANRERRALEITNMIRAVNDPQTMIDVALSELQKTLGITHAQVLMHPGGPAIHDNGSRARKE